MEDTLQLHEFFVEGGNAERSHALLHITEPSTNDEKKKGYFFAVCEIMGATNDYITEIQQTIDVIEKGYYEDTEHTNAETLEAILDQVNKQSATIVRRGIELHWMIGTIANHEIIFSFHGRPTIMLFYKNREGFYSSLDLVAQNPSEKTPHPTVFSQIIQGKVSSHDYLVVTTPHVRELYDNDRLQRIITTRSAEESSSHFERSFQESKRDLSFAGVIITAGKTIERRPTPAPRLPQVSRGSSESLKKLFHTEKNTTNTLASSFGKTMQNGIERLSKRAKDASTPVSPVFNQDTDTSEEVQNFSQPLSPTQRRRNANHDSQTKDYLVRIIRLIISGLILTGKWLLKVGIVIIGALLAAVRFLGTLIKAAINYKGQRQTLVSNWKRDFAAFRNNVTHLPFLTKLFLILTILIIIGVTGSVFYFNRQRAITTSRQQFQDSIKMLEKKKETVKKFLFFDDNTNARRELTEAQDLFNKLPCNQTKDLDQQATCKTSKNELEELAVKLRKTTSAPTEVITSWEQISSPLSSLVKVENLLMASSKNSSTIYLYNLLTNEGSTISAPSSTPGFTLSATTPGKDYAVFLTSSNELYSVNTKSVLKKQTLSLPKENATLGSILMYGNRLYTLDTTNAQIYRHERINSGFSLGNNWIKTGNENIRDAVSFAIDGDLYALKKNGVIAKYTSGEAQTFAIQNLDPALTSGQSIYTYDKFIYLYVLDSTEGRIIILKKDDGAFKAQLTAPELKNALSFTIDEGNKRGYFLNGNKIYRINLPL